MVTSSVDGTGEAAVSYQLSSAREGIRVPVNTAPEPEPVAQLVPEPELAGADLPLGAAAKAMGGDGICETCQPMWEQMLSMLKEQSARMRKLEERIAAGTDTEDEEEMLDPVPDQVHYVVGNHLQSGFLWPAGGPYDDLSEAIEACQTCCDEAQPGHGYAVVSAAVQPFGVLHPSDASPVMDAISGIWPMDGAKWQEVVHPNVWNWVIAAGGYAPE